MATGEGNQSGSLEDANVQAGAHRPRSYIPAQSSPLRTGHDVGKRVERISPDEAASCDRCHGFPPRRDCFLTAGSRNSKASPLSLERRSDSVGESYDAPSKDLFSRKIATNHSSLCLSQSDFSSSRNAFRIALICLTSITCREL